MCVSFIYLYDYVENLIFCFQIKQILICFQVK